MRTSNEHRRILEIIRRKNESPPDLDPHRAALLVVDLQRYFTRPAHPFTQVFEVLSPGSVDGYLTRVRERLLPNVRRLLRAFRELGAPVVFTAVGTDAGDGRELPGWLRGFDQLGLATLKTRIWPVVDDQSYQIDSSLEPRPGEVVLAKLSAGAFATTGLEQRLRNQGIEWVVVTGVSTDVCVATTAREAADRGFGTLVVSDACTTLSAEMHQAALDAFNLAFGWVRPTDAVLELLGRSTASITRETARAGAAR